MLVTQSPDYRRPSSACVLHKRLGLSIDCAALEINMGCSGFVYGMQTAMNMMEQSDAEYALLLIGETASKLVDPKDKSIVMMYGDAGAAILLERQKDAKTCSLLRTDGNRFKTISLPAGGFRDMNPPRERFLCSDGIERTLYDIYMEGTSVFSFSISDVPQALKDYLEHTGTSVEDYGVFVFHQANQFIIKQISRKLKLPVDKVPISLDRYGNTGGISIPLTLCDRYGDKDEGAVRALMSGFGIGLSWGITNAVIDTKKVFPIMKTKDYFREGKITKEMLM
jgi:3-oxoacyl-[acyl-carrier-protein] synthase-3